MNSTNMTWTNESSKYVFNPVNYTIKLSIACPTVVIGMYSLVANSLIFYFMQKKTVPNSRGFSRSSLTDRFIQSLCLSDVLCDLFSLAPFITEFFIDYVSTDSMCKVSRFILFVFPVVTIMNYLFIGVERYLGVYHPLRIPSERVSKSLVVVAWFVGAVVTALAVPAYALVRYDLDNNMYTMVCKYDNSVKMYRVVFFTFTTVAYIIPSIILTTTCIRILKFLRHQRRTIFTGGTNQSQSSIAQISRYKLTNMFVSLIFAFILPYMLFVAYNGTAMLLKLKISFIVDYTTRIFVGTFVYTNGAIGSTILFYNTAYLRQNLTSLFRKIFDEQEPSSAVNVRSVQPLDPKLQN